MNPKDNRPSPVSVEEAVSQSSRFYDALNGHEKIAYMTGAKFGFNFQSERIGELEKALQNIADSTDGNNPEHAVFYFTAINALKK